MQYCTDDINVRMVRYRTELRFSANYFSENLVFREVQSDMVMYTAVKPWLPRELLRFWDKMCRTYYRGNGQLKGGNTVGIGEESNLSK